MQVKSAFSNKESVLREVKATLSQRATLSCDVADSKTEVKWYKDGKLLASTKAIHAEAKGKTRQLMIESLEKKDAGEYICEAGTEKLVFNIQVEGRLDVTCQQHSFVSVLHTKISCSTKISVYCFCYFGDVVLKSSTPLLSYSPARLLCQGVTAEGSESFPLQEGHPELRGV